jgi:hypothetical protein
VTTREEKIVAKGKGELQTYWVNVRETSKSVASFSVEPTADSSVSVDKQEESAFSPTLSKQYGDINFD